MSMKHTQHPKFLYLTPGEAVPGASRLITIAHHNGTPVRAFRDAQGMSWFVLVDLFRAGQVNNTSTVRKRIKDPSGVTKVTAWVASPANPEWSGYRPLDAANEGAVEAMLGISKKPGSVALLAWIKDVALPLLREV